ncbi:MAG: GWxTD domain-containing protein [Acidobacteriota bacterium]
MRNSRPFATRSIFNLSAAALLFWGSVAAGAPGSKQERRKALRREEGKDYFRKWLKDDVVYIISDEERDVFQKLATGEEKERFIEQFWRRRDPDPRTAVNEFKEEHYRRIAYANEHFRSGKPGWKTDRGRVYIIHGPPEEREYKDGGAYHRKIDEGGGWTATFPFETWRYRYIEGMGNDIEIEFVDSCYCGQFQLALTPDEKDAMLHVPGGATLAEEIGAAEKKDRPVFNPANRNNYPYLYKRAKDSVFARYERFANIMKPEPIQHPDLRELVKVNLSYRSLDLQVRHDYFKLNPNQVLVPLTVQIKNQDLTFKPEGERQVARVVVYGLVTSIKQEIVKEFEEEFNVSYRPQDLQEGRTKLSMYQKVLVLEPKRHYKVVLVAKDVNSENVGVVRRGLAPPSYAGDRLTGSSLILAEQIGRPTADPQRRQMFVLGDLKVRPSMGNRFSEKRPLGIYLQLYNFRVDQATMAPSLAIRYSIFNSRGRQVASLVDEGGHSIQFFSDQRVVLINKLQLEGLEPGAYRVGVQVEDRVGKQNLSLTERFQVIRPPKKMASSD